MPLRSKFTCSETAKWLLTSTVIASNVIQSHTKRLGSSIKRRSFRWVFSYTGSHINFWGLSPPIFTCLVPRILKIHHMIPSFLSHIIATITLAIPGMILGETALSFLGLGLRAPVVSWGVMLQETQKVSVLALYPWLLFPAAAVIIVVLALNFLGDGLRDAADPYQSKR
jgi:hypothetical protein